MDDTATVDAVEPAGASPAAPTETVDAASERVGVPRVVGKWLPAPSRRRLLDHDIELLEDDATDGDLILVSTRAPAGSDAIVADLAAGAVPVVVVSHPGGESTAVDFVGAGARTVVAEGAEHLAIGLIDGTSHGQMLGFFRDELDAASGDPNARRGIDPITLLPTGLEFERRLEQLDTDAMVPRLGVIELPLSSCVRTLGSATVNGIRRRFAANLVEIAGHHQVELFDVGSDRIVFVGIDLDRNQATDLIKGVVDLAQTFAPTGRPLELAVGSAGPEVAGDPRSALASAERALSAARTSTGRVVDAEELTRSGAASLELDAAIHVADAVDRFDPRGDHQRRVGRLTIEIARLLGLDSNETAVIALAARLHDIGKMSFRAAAFDSDAPERESAVAEHPARGADYVRLAAGDLVAACIRSHHERWDGSGFPDGLQGADIPLGARIIAAADRVDDLEAEGTTGDRLVSVLRDDAGTALDPDVVSAVLQVLAER